MGQIVLLDELTTCKIAAGEVIERPASVVKEMVENSIDAGATSVSVEIKAGGIKYIRINDNGCGIAADDTEIAFDKHATSKIRCADDLESVATLGFRGEALASIAAVSDVELITRTEGTELASYVHIAGGKILEKGTKGGAFGTTFIVRDLFYNTPARYKFLKKDSTEAGYVCDVLQKLALAHPEVAIKLINGGTELLRTPGNGDLRSTIFSIYGKKVSEALREVRYNENGVSISGYIGVGDASSGNRSRQIFFVNGRCIKSKAITAALDEGCKTLVMKGRFAFAVLSITVSPYTVDVNVHPAKTEVRFSDEGAIFRAVVKAIPYNDRFYYGDRVEENIAGKAAVVSEPVKFPPQSPQPEISPRAESFVEPAYTPKLDKEAWKFSTEKPEMDELSFHAGTELNVNEDTWIAGAVSMGTELPEDKDVSEKRENILPERREIVNPFYMQAKIIGQVLNTYIVLEYNSSVFLLDQHAAHERLMYERLVEACRQDMCLPSQALLCPITVSLSPSELSSYEIVADKLSKLGFDIEIFGRDAIIIRAVPAVMSGQDIVAAVEALLAKGENIRAEDLLNEERLHTVACKAAVKGNNVLTNAEIVQLLHDLAVTDQPGTCPHGRPIVVEISKNDIEKRFKRIL